jgi:hypothetical protein
MAPDTPERFLSAVFCTRQDQTRFDGSAERARQRASPLAPENLLRTVGRRFKRQGSCAPVRHKLGGRVPRAIPGFVTRRQRRPGRGPNPSVRRRLTRQEAIHVEREPGSGGSVASQTIAPAESSTHSDKVLVCRSTPQ